MKILGWRFDLKLKNINYFLLCLIILTNSYVLVMPFIPQAQYQIRKNITKPVSVNANNIADIDRTTNHLVLPTIQLDAPVYEGQSPSTVHKGIWHRPQTNSPDQAGNTVLVGHRFTYAGAAVFYSLDKLRPNDDVYYVYNQKIYHYKIMFSKIVPPTATEVEAPTNDTKLTLYTCTPVWSAKDRLVYVANLQEVL